MTLAAAEFLTPDELATIRKRSDLRGIWCVAHAWLVVFGAMAALAWFPNPLVWAIGIVAWVVCLTKAWTGQRWRLPWLGQRLGLDG